MADASVAVDHCHRNEALQLQASHQEIESYIDSADARPCITMMLEYLLSARCQSSAHIPFIIKDTDNFIMTVKWTISPPLVLM